VGLLYRWCRSLVKGVVARFYEKKDRYENARIGAFGWREKRALAGQEVATEGTESTERKTTQGRLAVVAWHGEEHLGRIAEERNPTARARKVNRVAWQKHGSNTAGR
jgi:hypothetical protein